MLFPLHRIKDGHEVLVNSDFVIYAEQFPEYLEVVVLSDECLLVRENINQFKDLINGKRINYKNINNMQQDAISKDIKKKLQKRYDRKNRIKQKKIMKHQFCNQK